MAREYPASKRPRVAERKFASQVIERVIQTTCETLHDPKLAWLFENCFPNTLDTTVTCVADDGTGKPDTFVITGDIDAMWLRDSTNQVMPYMRFAKNCEKLRAMFQGLIRRQAKCVLLDAYANAFYADEMRTSPFARDGTEMRPGVHERKYELDSLGAVIRLVCAFVDATNDAAVLDETVIAGLSRTVAVIRAEQAGTPEQVEPAYQFGRGTANALDTLSGGGHGHPCKRTGMSRSPFRPSDDATTFQYLIPANALVAVNLQKLGDVLTACGIAEGLAAEARDLAFSMDQGIRHHGVVQHERYGPVFAYEVDGYGSSRLMDDANMPNLLGLPLTGFCLRRDPIYENTRRLILGEENPYFHQGRAGAGLGSPHVGLGWIWPMGVITQAQTSGDDGEIMTCLETLKRMAPDGFMHEAVWKDDPERFTRGWFAWANSAFGELILGLLETRRHLLARN